jgi:hypothetical protein
MVFWLWTIKPTRRLRWITPWMTRCQLVVMCIVCVLLITQHRGSMTITHNIMRHRRSSIYSTAFTQNILNRPSHFLFLDRIYI